MKKRDGSNPVFTTVAIVAFLISTMSSGSAFAASKTSPTSPMRTAASVQPSQSSTQQAEQSAKQIPVTPPPMGWSSWNSFSNTVDSAVIMQQTKALVASGMQKAGYRYINLDEGWWLGNRDKNGNIVVDPKQWPALKSGEQPGDMSNIVRYIHSLGLKAGIYTDAGESGCGFYSPDIGPRTPHTGSEGHYDQDFLQFAKWGFDYVKVDWCGGSRKNLDPAMQYAAIAHAIARAERITGHSLFFSICNWGKESPWTWAPGIGGVAADIWRTSGDIVNPIVAGGPHSDRKASFPGVLSNFDQGIHPEAQHTGFYNDPDMMVVGMPGLSEVQNRVHMSLWAISGAPLIQGADLTKVSKATTEILTNPEVIAVDQNSLGLQAIMVAQPAEGVQVWAKPLAHHGEYAVLLLNRTAAPAQVSVTWSEVGLKPSSTATVRDVWTHKDLGSYRSGYAATVAPNDAALLVIRGVDGRPTRYKESSVAIGSERALTFKVAPRQGSAYIQISYVNGDKKARTAQLKVNDQVPTNINFPPTGGSDSVGIITIEAEFKQGGKENSLTFSSSCAPGPVIDSISILPGSSH